MVSSSIPYRRCAKCGHEFPLTTEYFHKAGKAGFHYYCRTCLRKTPLPKPVAEGMKRCSRCENVYPATLEFFHKGKGYKNGLKANCKSCQLQDNQQWKNAHLEQVRDGNYRWRAANPDKVQKIQRRYSETHREENRERSRLYRSEHPDKRRIHKRIRRSRKRAVLATFTHSEWERCLEYWNGCCAVCGRQLKDLFGTLYASQDHWIPLTKGGGYIAKNIVPLCSGLKGCNNSKNNSFPLDWLNRKFGKRKAKQILTRIEAYFEWVKGQG